MALKSFFQGDIFNIISHHRVSYACTERPNKNIKKLLDECYYENNLGHV